MLLQLGDIQEALTRAAAAQRPQLMHQVVRHLMKEQKRADYELTIRKIPLVGLLTAFFVYSVIITGYCNVRLNVYTKILYGKRVTVDLIR